MLFGYWFMGFLYGTCLPQINWSHKQIIGTNGQTAYKPVTSHALQRDWMFLIYVWDIVTSASVDSFFVNLKW